MKGFNARSWTLQYPGDSMNTGWGQLIPDVQDENDFPMHRIEEYHPNVLSQVAPSEAEGHTVDLSNMCSPVRDQGLLDACVGFALAGLVEFLQKKRGGPVEMCSPRFIWFYARKYDFNSALNVGAQLRNGMRVLAHAGTSPEHLDPYDPMAYAPFSPDDGYEVEAALNTVASREPSSAAIAAAQQYVIDAYYRLGNLADFKRCLDSGYALVMSVPIFKTAIEQALASGRVPMPEGGEEPVATHSVLVTGYTNDRTFDGGGYLLCKGSQGRRRGDNGYFKVPYAYHENWNGDAWTATRLLSESDDG